MGHTDWSWKQHKSCLLGQMPFAIIDGVSICQSRTIERALAVKLDMAGSTPTEKAVVDMLVETAQELSEAFYTLMMCDQFSRDRKVFLNETVPAKLSLLEKMLEHAQKAVQLASPGLSIGKATIADATIFETIARVIELAEAFAPGKDVVADAPRTRALLTAFKALPGIKKYLESGARAKYIAGPYANFSGKPIPVTKQMPPELQARIRKMTNAKWWRGKTVPQIVAPISFLSGVATSFVGLLIYGALLLRRNNMLQAPSA
eukprot:NODE_956_length_1072_cov_298.169110_g786_i0.p1 GENE.NODE_956_length_1072_cov_298.169110_g786_i0~~NODE_956_length_1072_cov_298.169110_g786_i0.p1  ORF type:complete len:269 (+),score=51.04 NODE_956_length_1072_cov_298.169110_g786_i0:27-809(+)